MRSSTGHVMRKLISSLRKTGDMILTPEQRERIMSVRYDVDIMLTLRQAQPLEVCDAMLKLIDALTNRPEDDE